MDRRRFLKQTGLTLTTLIAASALDAVPVAAATPASTAAAEPVRDLMTAPRLTVTRLAMREAGEYRVSGTIRFESPTVEIGGIANSQQITWSGAAGQLAMVASFTSYETYDGRDLAPAITVRGGRLESLSVVPVDYR